jgi:hypothetical protein
LITKRGPSDFSSMLMDEDEACPSKTHPSIEAVDSSEEDSDWARATQMAEQKEAVSEEKEAFLISTSFTIWIHKPAECPTSTVLFVKVTFGERVMEEEGLRMQEMNISSEAFGMGSTCFFSLSPEGGVLGGVPSNVESLIETVTDSGCFSSVEITVRQAAYFPSIPLNRVFERVMLLRSVQFIPPVSLDHRDSKVVPGCCSPSEAVPA